MKALRASGASASVSEDAETYSRKIQGRRKEPAVEEDRDDPLQVFRRKFFELQNDLRSDKDVSYFDEEIEGFDSSTIVVTEV